MWNIIIQLSFSNGGSKIIRREEDEQPTQEELYAIEHNFERDIYTYPELTKALVVNIFQTRNIHNES